MLFHTLQGPGWIPTPESDPATDVDNVVKKPALETPNTGPRWQYPAKIPSLFGIHKKAVVQDHCGPAQLPAMPEGKMGHKWVFPGGASTDSAFHSLLGDHMSLCSLIQVTRGRYSHLRHTGAAGMPLGHLRKKHGMEDWQGWAQGRGGSLWEGLGDTLKKTGVAGPGQLARPAVQDPIESRWCRPGIGKLVGKGLARLGLVSRILSLVQHHFDPAGCTKADCCLLTPVQTSSKG